MAEVNGTLYVLAPTAFDNVEHSYDELRQLDPATLEETAVLLEKQGLCGMGADAEGRLVLSRAAGLFAFDPETGSETEILRWNALDTAAITGIFLQRRLRRNHEALLRSRSGSRAEGADACDSCRHRHGNAGDADGTGF